MNNSAIYSRKFDVIIIGAGPGGLFAAYKMIECFKEDVNILVIDKGELPYRRNCAGIVGACKNCRICDLISGGGGAGLFSDGKFILDLNVGGHLGEFISHKHKKGLEEYIKEIIEKFSASYIYRDTESESDLPTCLEEQGLSFKFYPVINLGSRSLRKFLSNFMCYLQRSEVSFLFNTEVLSVENRNSDGKWVIEVQRNGCLNRIESDRLIVSVGKEGNFWLSSIIEGMGGKTEENNAYLGIRLEVSDPTARVLHKLGLDPKISRSVGDVKTKTHCFCMHGQVLLVKYFGLPLAAGHAPLVDSDKNYTSIRFPNSNLAILHRVNALNAQKKAIEYMKKVSSASEGNLLVQRLGDYINDIPTTNRKLNNNSIKPSNLNIAAGSISNEILPGFRDEFLSFLECLGACIPDMLNPDNLIYAPAIEWWMKRIIVNEHMGVLNLPNLYAIGDGSGLTQGIVQSAASGIIAAERIAAKNGGEIL